MSDEESLQDLIFRKQKDNKIVISTFEGYMSMDIDKAIDEQPVEGLLYDLNRLGETALTFMDKDPKWVNDYAVALVIERLHNRLKATETVLAAENPHWKVFVDKELAQKR